MKGSIRLFLTFFIVVFLATGEMFSANAAEKAQKVTVVIPSAASARMKFGAEKLSGVLKGVGYTVSVLRQDKISGNGVVIAVGRSSDALVQNMRLAVKATGKEGFAISSFSKNRLVINGFDDSGALYGCMELAERIASSGKIPENISLTDKPEMVLRGTCIGVQKPALLPGRGVYEYPYTPESFPWFYDKALWVKYLDMMVENRYNSLYLWNGHPFASLVKLKEYPYAVEVDDATFRKNEEMFRFLTEEADKRGIWVIQMFYNIIVSKPFAEKHQIKTQDRNRPILPVIADYTRKSIAAFVEKYPNVGLLITLGEAMEGVGQDDVDWFTKTIIPGVQDGMKSLGLSKEPPIVLRVHDTDAPRVMKAALPLYKNLYTMAKYNGEALTTYTPRGKWADLHRSLSRIGTVHIENVHILANLEPFRYGSADFIQKSVQAMHDVYEANGLHLYPQASYWDWPYAADNVKGRLLQTDRDWIWYKTWARYAWNCRRDRADEINYWSGLLSTKYGTDLNKGKDILEAYEQTGEIAPKLLRRYGITDGNRQTLTLGMFMTQLINPFRYGLFTLMYESEAPEGEMIIEYAEKEWKGQKHIGETPVQVAAEVTEHGRKAVEAIDKAATAVSKDNDEFTRLRNDVHCYNELAGFYAEKVRAALLVLKYKYSNDVADLEKALPFLENSVKHYRKLTELTKDTYLYANSMQTSQRKIPVRGVDATYKTWVEVLPRFEEELIHFKRSIDSLKSDKSAGKGKMIHPFKNADVKVLSDTEGYFTINTGEQVFRDTTAKITGFAKELAGLRGIKINRSLQKSKGTAIKFTTGKAVKLLVGFFNSKAPGFLPPPDLEHDATANEYGQSEIKIANALALDGMAPLNIHSYSFKPGTHTLTLAKGTCVILGFIDDNERIRLYDAGIGVPESKRDIDWLFE
ncbi:hypothetical protein BDE36_3914 [Arcticibacter tournemirensis]|uniref:Beta-hexosaminidase bacterial type N-terminal domain-containing protein n=1 Tax=Arcticibacter tournemirensis TaxID=699437 RepID=A0A5M9HIQ3_9SPHI|nr:hypothetical protein [Arcticibacter tournemirensis]KAA8486303.1 hypothetical protein F1649_01590 [Arcticibacter tournemirensis]TQM52114.1 hypothetical protein BDE36_3914 [Arcticibacter tournemirensis]